MKDIVKELGVDAVLVSEGCNMRHLSGFAGATGYLLLTPEKKYLMTDSRYTTQAESEAQGFEITEANAKHGYSDLLESLFEQEKIKSIGFEDQHMIYADIRKFMDRFPNLEWKPLGEELNLLRMIKTEEELILIEKAESIGDQAFERILKDLKPGVTELEIAAKLDYYMRILGAEANSFDTIVASGIHSAMPHAVPTAKKLEDGDFVTMDFGCKYHGYCSDMTRTVVIGKATEKQKKIYHLVLEAQLNALNHVHAGMTGAEGDAFAREIIENAGYGAYFGHGLGHSVGLYIHEEPRLSPKCETILRPNVTMSVEPGIYLPDFGGVRIEDLVVLEENGCRNLTHSPKELLEL